MCNSRTLALQTAHVLGGGPHPRVPLGHQHTIRQHQQLFPGDYIAFLNVHCGRKLVPLRERRGARNIEHDDKESEQYSGWQRGRWHYVQLGD